MTVGFNQGRACWLLLPTDEWTSDYHFVLNDSPAMGAVKLCNRNS